ncbi:unnamed protein product [Boreogadus saida]
MMRRTAAALCIYCFTLVSYLQQTTAGWDEEPAALHWTMGAEGPCAVTLTPAGTCGQDQDTCTYWVHLPPLTVQLPKQLKDLDEIVKEIQRLKDTVDQLRRSCGDCTGNQNERGEEARPRDRERGKDNHPQQSLARVSETRNRTKEEWGMDKVEDWVSGNTDPGWEKLLEDRGREKIVDQRGKDKIVKKEREKEGSEEGDKGNKGVDNSRQTGQAVDRSTFREISAPAGSREDEVRGKIAGKEKDRRKEVETEKEEESVQGKEKLKNMRRDDDKDREEMGTTGNGGHLWSDPNEMQKEGKPSGKVWERDEARPREDRTVTNTPPHRQEKETGQERNYDKPKLDDVTGRNKDEHTTTSGGEGAGEKLKEEKKERDNTGLRRQKVSKTPRSELVTQRTPQAKTPRSGLVPQPNSDTTEQPDVSANSSIENVIPTPSLGQTNPRPGTIPTPSPGDTNPGSKTTPRPGDTNPGSKNTPSPGDTNPGSKTTPSPGDTNPESKITPSPGDTNQGSKTTPRPGGTNPGSKSTPSPGDTNPGSKTTPRPGGTNPGSKTTPRPGDTNPGSKITPSPGDTNQGSKTTPSPGGTNPGSKSTPRTGDTNPGSKTSPSPGDTNQGSKTTPSPGDTNPGSKTTPRPGDTNPGSKTSPSPGDTNPGSKTTPRPGGTNPGSKTTPRPGDTNPGSKTTPSPGDTNQGSKTTPSPGDTNPGSKTTPSPGGTNPGSKTSPSPGDTNQGSKTTPRPGDTNPGSKSTPRPGGTNPGSKTTPSPGDTNPGSKTTSSPGGANPGSKTTPNPGHSISWPWTSPIIITNLGHIIPGRITTLSPGYNNPGHTNTGGINPGHTNTGDSNRVTIGGGINPGLHNPDIHYPDLRNPDLRNPELRSPELRSPELRNPELRNPELRNPELRNPELRSPVLRNPDTPHPLPRPALPPSPGRTNPGLTLTPIPSTTPSTREMRVKINQVVAFPDASLHVKPQNELMEKTPPKVSLKQGGKKPHSTDGRHPIFPSSKLPRAPRDCSEHLNRGDQTTGLHLVTPDPRLSSFPVFCDMEHQGGGWTVIQRRRDGSVSFNRTWVEYSEGFGEMNGGEFWLGNEKIHLLTRARDMVLRVELEDFEGLREHAEYGKFRVASERQRYRLTVGGYSGSAGDALRFSRNYDHHNKAFTTLDRDNDRYPSGNCGAYYSSGWWFDACMAANLNGRYYVGKYKGVRDGIFWGTWHNISTEYYLTNDRQSFKTVTMMIRPKGHAL